MFSDTVEQEVVACGSAESTCVSVEVWNLMLTQFHSLEKPEEDTDTVSSLSLCCSQVRLEVCL